MNQDISTASEMQDVDTSSVELTEEEITPEQALKEYKKMQTALKKANLESAQRRIKLKELEEFKTKIDSERMDNVERLQSERDTWQNKYAALEREHQEFKVKTKFSEISSQMGIVDPDVVSKLVNWADIEYDDSGMPTNIQNLLKDLIEKKPYLAGKQSRPSVGATNPTRAAVTYNDADAIVQKLRDGKLSGTDYDALSPEMKQKVNKAMHARR